HAAGRAVGIREHECPVTGVSAGGRLGRVAVPGADRCRHPQGAYPPRPGVAPGVSAGGGGRSVCRRRSGWRLVGVASGRRSGRLAGLSLHASVIVLLIYGGMLGLTGWSFKETPKGFIPPQDMGYLMINVQLPDSASMERTRAVMEQIEHIAKEVPGIRHVTTVAGQSFVLNAFAPNVGSSFVNLQDYADRRDPDRSSEVIAN